MRGSWSPLSSSSLALAAIFLLTPRSYLSRRSCDGDAGGAEGDVGERWDSFFAGMARRRECKKRDGTRVAPRVEPRPRATTRTAGLL